MTDLPTGDGLRDGLLQSAGLPIDRPGIPTSWSRAGDLARDRRDIHAEGRGARGVARARRDECGNRQLQARCPIDRVTGSIVQLPSHRPIQRCVVDALLVPVIELCRPLGDVGAMGDLLHRRAVEPVLPEDLDRGLQQRVTPILGDDVRFGGPLLGVPMVMAMVMMTVHSVE